MLMGWEGGEGEGRDEGRRREGGGKGEGGGMREERRNAMAIDGHSTE